MNQELAALLEKAKKITDSMTPEQKGGMAAEQRRSHVIAEARFGDDADEAEYRDAVLAKDADKIARLNAEADARAERAAIWLTENGYA